MSFSASRLTCYALISAMEEDMRRLVENTWPDLLLDDLPEHVVVAAQARRTKDKLPSAVSPAALLPYTDFADCYQIIAPRLPDVPVGTRSAFESLKADFDRVISIRNQVAHTRPMRIDDSAFLADQAEKVVNSDRANWPSLAETMRRVAENPAYVLGLTPVWAVDEESGRPLNNLPTPEFDETGFFGRKEELAKLKRLIKGSYPVVSVLGTGGIGKTALTVQAAYDLLDDAESPFEAIVWVSAKSAVLTHDEIQVISGAVKDSLGLFTQAAEFLGGAPNAEPLRELHAYLETFKVLLILDNLETVLDPILREFISDIPLGSKVIVTSRISLGMIDNPISLGPLTESESISLLYALCRARGVSQFSGLPSSDVKTISERLNGHPSYIRWFVAGLQAGRRAEEILGDNGLLLEYCMSNVYDHLATEARALLSTFQVLPSGKNMGELAYLNNLSSSEVERLLLELLTTNFVGMSSHPRQGSFDSVYSLSEYTKEYLDRHHPVSRERRASVVRRNAELREQGAELSSEMSRNPYDPDTITIRGAEDAPAARLLKLARAHDQDEAALQLCAEAQKLAPHYAETYRVEGDIRARIQDDAGARDAYERSVPLSDSATTKFHYATFLLNEGIEVQKAVNLFQQAARIDENSAEIACNTAWGHYLLSDWDLALAAAKRTLQIPGAPQSERIPAWIIAMRAVVRRVEGDFDVLSMAGALEDVEELLGMIEGAEARELEGEASDLIVLLMSLVEAPPQGISDYFVRACRELSLRLAAVTKRLGVSERMVGHFASIKREKGFAFVRASPSDYFVHVYDLINSDSWDSLVAEERCCYAPRMRDSRWRAEEVRVLRL